MSWVNWRMDNIQGSFANGMVTWKQIILPFKQACFPYTIKYRSSVCILRWLKLKRILIIFLLKAFNATAITLQILSIKFSVIFCIVTKFNKAKILFHLKWTSCRYSTCFFKYESVEWFLSWIVFVTNYFNHCPFI